MQVECLVKAHNLLGECPLWCEETSSLYWVDIEDKKFYCFNTLLGTSQYYTFPLKIGSFCLAPNHQIIAACENKIYRIHLDNFDSEVMFEVNDQNIRFNDGKCDRRGRFWVGTTDLNFNSKIASLYRVDNNITKLREGLICSNGLDWSPDDSIFYLTDSGTNTIYSYQYNLEQGSFNNESCFILDSNKTPDGLCVDCDGFIWSAKWGEGKVIRYDSNGNTEREILLPVKYPTSCAFGGKEMNTLFITSAAMPIQEKDPYDNSMAGGIFYIKTKTKGLSQTFFAY